MADSNTVTRASLEAEVATHEQGLAYAQGRGMGKPGTTSIEQMQAHLDEAKAALAKFDVGA